MADYESLHLPHPLRPYQWEGVSFLARRDVALLADEMGLGKTVQTAVALRLVMSRGNCRRVLIVTPASLRLNWERELARWVPDLVVRRVEGSVQDRLAWYILPVSVLLASYEQVRADALALHPSVHFDLVVLDEAQRIKNLGSDTSLACQLLPRRMAWALTGTPLENRPSDMIAVFRFLKSDLLYPGMSRGEIHSRMTDSFLRRKKSDVLRDLPPIICQDMPLELDGEQLQAYLDAWASRSDRVNYKDGLPSTSDMLTLITRLKQLCNFDPCSGESVKLEALRLILESLRQPTDKIIIFSQYVQTLEWLAQQLEIPHDVFHGGLSESDRDRVVSDFEDKPGPRALLISLRAGGLGLNLPGASVVVLFDRWWNPAVESQAIQRAHRFGRERPLHVVRFLVVGSIEERIARTLEQKQMLFEEYVENAISATVEPYTHQELRWVLQLPEKTSSAVEDFHG